MAKKKLSSKSNYVPNRMINEIEVERNGKTTYIDGANVLDGMYVKKGVKFAKGGSIQKIVSNFTPVAVKHSGNEKEGYSVLIKDKKSDFTAWVDVWVDTEYQDVNTDWNMYIFDLKDTNDVRQKTLQENTDIFEDATSTAIQYLEDKGVIMQDDKAKWHYAKGKKALGGFLVGVGVGVAGKYAYDKYGKKGTTKRVAKGKKKKFGNGGGVAVSSENGGYTIGTNADYSSNHPSTDVDYSMYAKGGGVGKNRFKLGDKVKVVRGANKGEKGIVSNTDSDFFGDYTIDVRGHKLSGFKADDLIKYAKGGSLKSKAKYVPNYMVQSVEVERKGKTTDIDGADIYDGFYVKKGVKFAKGGNLKTKNGVSYKVIEFNSPMGKYKYVINGLKIGGYNFSYVSDKKLSDAEIERVASENKFANGGSVWGGTAESSQDGMLIGGTNAELTSNQYGSGGKITSADEGTGSSDLREKAQAKIDKGMTVIDFSYTDYGGSFGDKVAIAYFKKHHPKNILVENSAYNGQNAFVFGKVADEYLEAIEDYPLGFEDMEEFYYDMQNQVEEKEFKSFVKELKSDGYKVSPNTLNWLMENKSGYYRLEPNMLDYSPESLTEELIEEGLVSKKMEDGGMLGSWSYSIGGL